MSAPAIHGPCGCRDYCGDVWQDEDDPSMPICKGLPVRHVPLVEVVLKRRDKSYDCEVIA